jgi:hypothetical protein
MSWGSSESCIPQNQCVTAAFAEMSLKFGVVERSPPRFVDHVLGCPDLLQATRQQQLMVQLNNIGQKFHGNL